MMATTDLSGPQINVLVIGAGMYVCGRGTEGYGTVLPTLVQAQRHGEIGEIWVAATRAESGLLLQRKLDELNALMETKTTVRLFPGDGVIDSQAYRKAIAELPLPACAIVAVPDHLHASIAADVIRAGLHLMVVKPLAPTLAEARHLVELIEAHDVYGAVDFHKRFDEANLLLRQTLVDRRLGDLCYITVEFSQRRLMRQAFRSWIQYTNIFQYLGVHYVDLIYFVTGARPVRAIAIGQPHALMSSNQGDLDAIEALVEWEDRTTGRRFVSTIATNWVDPDNSSAMSDQKIAVVGTRGRYESDQKHRGVQLVTEDGGVEDVNPYFTQLYAGADGSFGVHGYGPRSIYQFLADARNVVAGRSPRQSLVSKRPSFQEALVSTAVIEAVSRSLSRKGEWVAVEETPPLPVSSNLASQEDPYYGPRASQ